MPDNAAAPRLKGRSFAETRSAVLDLIRVEGSISRSDLARRSALTEKTISVVVKSLMESSLVVESGFARSTGGKRPVLLRLNDRELFAVGISVDEARCMVVVCGLDGIERARSELRGSGADSPPAVLKRMAGSLTRLLNRHGIDKQCVVGICLAVGGRRGASQGWHADAALASLWEAYPSEVEFARLTGLSVLRENDANCAALGEFWTAGNSSRDFVTVYMAHGVGCGIVIGGTIYKGASGNAGEIGHMQIDPNGLPCWCGRVGCLDTVASPQAITRRVMADPGLARACDVTAETEFGEVFRRFGDLVKQSNPAATAIFTGACENLAAVITDLVNALDLDLISLAGPAFSLLGEEYLSRISGRLREMAFMRDVHPITVRLGTAGVHAAALGAASVVLHRHLTPHHSAL